MYHFQEVNHIPISKSTKIPEGSSLEDFRGVCGYQYEALGNKIRIELPLFESWPEDKEEFSFGYRVTDYVIYRTNIYKRIIPVVAIRAEKGLLYFPEDTKGIKLDYLILKKEK